MLEHFATQDKIERPIRRRDGSNVTDKIQFAIGCIRCAGEVLRLVIAMREQGSVTAWAGARVKHTRTRRQRRRNAGNVKIPLVIIEIKYLGYQDAPAASVRLIGLFQRGSVSRRPP